ncbi:uncharacterized protein BX663DRAFT_423663, partial [Cokeromyces recurvatus]|uniref:uncharacterized protein n=1 Tax=Cokeromyces recurvatus TaxID=90255 RepID=UPI00222057E4
MNQDQMISSGIQNELLRLDENSLHTKYKFGVLLIKEGQTKEEEWLSNDGYDSEGFNEFLDIIGRKIELKGYMGWAAGLDTKGGDSGEYAYINVWNENTLAYHVSTLIPSKPGDKQQVQRKRHIGNDIVCIIFVEGKQPFNPTAIKSQFLHVFIVVHQELFPANNKKAWRVEIVYVEDVPSFGPSLPNKSALFFDRDELEKFLLAKLVNAEYAAFKSPKFALPMNRAREGIFSSLVGKGYNLLLTNTENDLLTLQQQESMTETNKPFQKHIRSASISSTLLMASSNSSSNMTREFSNLNKRRIQFIAMNSDMTSPILLSSHEYSQYPSNEQFNAIVNAYLMNLSLKKRDKALVDHERYALILKVLKDPRNTSISTAQFRFWVKKMFRMDEEIVCHDNKPVAVREDIYYILILAHKEAQHGGRDKTSAIVRRRYSWIPKELIARFVRHCPFCISRRN